MKVSPKANKSTARRRIALTGARLVAAVFVSASCCLTNAQPTSAQQMSQAELAEIRRAAEDGDPSAQFKMGQMAEWQKELVNNTIVGNYQVASEWYQKAAAQGHVKAMFRLGELYYYGKLGHNHPEAAKWFRKAAEKGDMEAVMRLGELYSVSHPDLNADPAEAARWYRILAEQGNATAQYRLGCILAESKDSQQETEAQRWLQKATQAGLAEAALRLVELKKQPPGTVLQLVNREQLAEAFYRGGGATRFLLARAYEEGLGGPEDFQAAAETYWSILNLGPDKDRGEALRRVVNLYAQQKVGFWSSAVYSPKSPEGLAKLLKSYSALVSSPDSQFQVAEMFLRGDVLPKDGNEAVQWLARAARSGSAAAMNRLGTLWMTDFGGGPDPLEAVNWFRKAADKGFAEAQFNLGKCYAEGKGVAADLVQAWCWFQLAAVQRFPGAASERDKLQAKLSPAQLAEAKERLAYIQSPPNTRTGPKEEIRSNRR